MTLNRLLAIAGFLLVFAALSHANDLSQILSRHNTQSNTLVCEQGPQTTEHLKFGGVSK